MRKAGMWVLILACLICLTACGAEEKQEAPEATVAPTVTEAAMAATQVPTETTQPQKEIAFEAMTAYEDERCRIQFTGLQSRKDGNFAINVTVENLMENMPFMVEPTSLAVNGVSFDLLNDYYFDFSGDMEIPAASSVSDILEFKGDCYDRIYEKVGALTDIEVSFQVWDAEDLSFTIQTPVVHVCPYGEESAMAVTRESLPTDNVIADNEYGTVIVTGYEKDEWYFRVHLFVVNKTDNQYAISTKDWSSVINGVSIFDGYNYSIGPGKCGYSNIVWWTDDLKEAGIDQVETIDLNLQTKTFDPEKDINRIDWYEDIEVTLNP